LEGSGQLHAFVALPPEKEPWHTLNRRFRWTVEQVIPSVIQPVASRTVTLEKIKVIKNWINM
jgi:hypothetical protein